MLLMVYAENSTIDMAYLVEGRFCEAKSWWAERDSRSYYGDADGRISCHEVSFVVLGGPTSV